MNRNCRKDGSNRYEGEVAGMKKRMKRKMG
jgi:hypothetical protein